MQVNIRLKFPRQLVLTFITCSVCVKYSAAIFSDIIWNFFLAKYRKYSAEIFSMNIWLILIMFKIFGRNIQQNYSDFFYKNFSYIPQKYSVA